MARRRFVSLFAGGALALVAILAVPGVVLGHHASVTANVSCAGAVQYTINDWTTDNRNHQAQATFAISYQTNADAWWQWHTIGSGSFTSSNAWHVDGSFTVSTSVTKVTIRVNDFHWGDGATTSGPWTATASRSTTCPTPTPDSDPNADSDPDAYPDPDAYADAYADADADADPATPTQRHADANSDADANRHADPDRHPDSDAVPVLPGRDGHAGSDPDAVPVLPGRDGHADFDHHPAPDEH